MNLSLQKEVSKNKLRRKERQAARQSSSLVLRKITKRTVGLVVRIKEAKHISGEIKSQLRELQLTHIHDAKFVVLNEDTMSKLSHDERTSL